jgi:hypothetical protein
MKSTSSCSLLLSLLLGSTVMFLSGCKNEVNVTLAENGKIVLYPKHGDRIAWAQGTNGVQVHFLVNPCEETDTWIQACTVKVNLPAGESGQYNYICKNAMCKDPEVDVGSSVGTRRYPPIVTARAPDPEGTVEVALPCDGGTIKPSPADVPGDLYGPITPGQVVQWISNGSPVLPDWTITFDGGNTSVCVESDIHNANGFRNCTIKPGLAPRKYTYQASSGHCGTGTGSVTTAVNNR